VNRLRLLFIIRQLTRPIKFFSKGYSLVEGRLMSAAVENIRLWSVSCNSVREVIGRVCDESENPSYTTLFVR
jgi:hypothetical protein